MELQTGDLLLCTGRGITSKGLQIGQGILHGTVVAPYSHASIVLAPGYLLEAVYDKGVWVNCLFDGKAQLEHYRGKVVLPFRPWQHGYTKFHIYRHPYFTPITDVAKREFINIAMKYYGEDYASKFHFLNLLHHRMQDTLKIRKLLKERSASRRDRMSIGESFCSELAARVYGEFGLSIPQKHFPSPVALGRKNWAFERVRHMEMYEKDIHTITGLNKSQSAWNIASAALYAQSFNITVHFQGNEVDRFVMEQIRLLNTLLPQEYMDPFEGIKAAYQRSGREIANRIASFENTMTFLSTNIEHELSDIARSQVTQAPSK